MKALFDTSLLVAALVHSHPRHSLARPWLERAHSAEVELHTAAHSLAEIYAVLTKLPTRPRIRPDTAVRMIEQGVLSMTNLVSLNGDEYKAVIGRLADSGQSGGITYDALIAHAAEKAQVDCLVTLNRRHFLRVWPEASARIIEPQEV